MGIGITYYVICSFFNSTDVILNAESVRVLTHPLPWPGNRVVALADVRDTVVRTRSNYSNQGVYNLVVMYIDDTNKERRLVTGIKKWDQAEYIEEQIRRAAQLAERTPPAKD